MNKKILINILLILTFVFLSSLLLAKSKSEDYSIIVNLAGRERMLIQKMVKEAILIYAGIDVEGNRATLNHSIELFAKTLKGLRDGDLSLQLPPVKSESIKQQINKVELEFKEIGGILTRISQGENPSRDAVMELVEKEPALLANMNTIVEMFELEARTALSDDVAFLGIEINLAGKQRMLTQKMAKEALLIYLGIDSRNNKMLLHQTSMLFDKTLKGLKFGDGALGLPGAREEGIIAQIDVAMAAWNELKPIIEKSCDIMVERVSREEIEAIAKLNTSLLNKIEEIVKLYESSGS